MCPYSLEQLKSALWVLDDLTIPEGLGAEEIWLGLSDSTKVILVDYFGRPDGAQ